MGNNHSNKLNNNSNHNNLDINTSSNSKIDDQEYPQLGSVNVQLSWLATTNRNTQQTEITVNGKGALFHGSQLPSNDILNALSSVKLNPVTVPLLDSKAHHFLITYSNGWNAISSPEIFSRHSGTCIIIGDRSNIGKPYPIKVGDCFRLGSVGVVVSEVKNDRGIEQRLDTNRLQYLREEALAFEGDDEAALAADEEDLEKRKVEKTSHEGGLGENNAPFFCYMCYETHDTPEDHLVAPCECKGDTRYLHVQCLQKWYQSSVCGSKALVIRTTGNGAPACKICGAAYKTVFRNNGVKTNLLEMDHPGPYISLVVVTRHDTSPGLFNTKFRLNFGPGYRVGGLHSQLQEDPDLTPVELSIGRSSLCNMVLDYRTVSTVHAKLTYRNGQFYVQDSRSSNGTMVYLQGPLPLPNNETIRLRMGRSTLAIKAKRSFSATMRGALHRLPNSIPCTASLERLQEIMALAPAPLPRSIRLGADVEPQNLNNNNNNNNNNSVNNNYNSSNMATNLSNIDNINLNNNNNNNSNNNQQQLQQEQQEQVNISNLPEDNLSNQYISINRSDEIDQALILGPERRDGGSGHEKLDSPIHSQNSWHQTLSPNPLTKPLSQRSSSTSPPPQQQQQLQLHQSLSNQNLIIDNSNNVNNNNNNNNNNNGNLNEVDILKSESSLSSSTQNSNEINNKNNNKVILETNQRETIHISKINLSSCDESDNVSLVSGGGDSVSMVAVNSSINPLSAISTGPKIIHIPTHECDESVSNSDIQSNQAVASIQNISRALVSDIMSNTLKS